LAYDEEVESVALAGPTRQSGAWLALGIAALVNGCAERGAPATASIELTAAAGSYELTRYEGTFVADCANQLKCGPAVRGTVPNTCGGSGAVPSTAVRITVSAFPDDDLIGQCCPGATLDTESLGVKACPKVGPAGVPVPTFCGSSPRSACGACPGFPITARFCHVRYHGGALETCYSQSAGAPATELAQTTVPDLWPPRHETVTLDVAECLEHIDDPCDPELTAGEVVTAPGFKITSVSSDPPGGDIEQLGPHTVALVPERPGDSVASGGRTFHVGVSYENPWKVTTTVDCRWVVPHDQGRRPHQ
jgi:hypothetical protein